MYCFQKSVLINWFWCLYRNMKPFLRNILNNGKLTSPWLPSEFMLFYLLLITFKVSTLIPFKVIKLWIISYRIKLKYKVIFIVF